MYFFPTTARADFFFKVILPSLTYGLDWYTPSDQVLAQSKWPTVEDLYKYRLLMLAHNCFYNFLSVPIMKLFTKYECNYNFRRKFTLFSKGKVRTNEFFGSNPKIVPATTVSSMAMEAERADHSHHEDEELPH